MSAFLRALKAPGAMRETIAAAPSQFPQESKCDDTESDIGEAPGYTVRSKPKLLDRCLDATVHASGSPIVFIIIQVLLFAWAFLGIPFSETTIWPVIISDAQAIFSYIFDSFLMRQQLNGYHENLMVTAELRSRHDSCRRMLTALSERIGDDREDVVQRMSVMEPVEIHLPAEGRFTKVVSLCAKVLGHILFVAVYWIGIFIWLGLGPMNDWSDQWQLDINSATSALMVFIFSFLAILREQHTAHLRACLDAIYRIDSTLERRLRTLTHDPVSNPSTLIPPIRIGPLQRAITYYADIIGTLVGIALLLIVLIIWLAIGPALHFDANWWLLIGTYAGLIGMNDGFVLRNMQALHRRHEDTLYAAVRADDAATFRTLGLAEPGGGAPRRASLSHRASEFMNGVCGHEGTVLVGVVVIFGLLIGASVMKWTETGQLLCNIPPSIIESFFMIILITGHNAADGARRVDMEGLFQRRRTLLTFVDAAGDFMAGAGARDGDDGLEKGLVRVEDAAEE